MVQRVVQVVQHLAPGGIETMVLELQRMAGPDTVTHIVSLEGVAAAVQHNWPRTAAVAGRLHCLGKAPGVEPMLVARLVRLFRKLRPAVVHTHHIGPLLYGGLAARVAGVPRIVHTEHDAWHLVNPRRLRLQRMALRLVGPQVLAAGRSVAAGLSAAVPSCRPLVMANGIDTDQFCPGDRLDARRRLDLPPWVTIVGAAGRLERVKGHDVLLDAAYRLPASVHVAIAGGGSQRARLETQARDLGMAGRVHFLGHVEDVTAFYRALDVFCLPSRSEGLPLALLEAQACGVPAVASDVGGVREALCPATSLLVPAEDSRRLAASLEALLGLPLPESPRSFVLTHYDINSMARAYRALLVA